MNPRDFLFFEKMLTPKILIIVYWLSLVAVVLTGIGTVFSGEFLKGLLIILLGPIGVRVYCEFFVVIFQLNKNVQNISNAKTQDASDVTAQNNES